MMTPQRPPSLRSMPPRRRQSRLVAFVVPAEHDPVVSPDETIARNGSLLLPALSGTSAFSPKLSEGGDGWPVQGCTVNGEMRTMARAIPADFQRVPVHVASEMSASGGMQMK